MSNCIKSFYYSYKEDNKPENYLLKNIYTILEIWKY